MTRGQAAADADDDDDDDHADSRKSLASHNTITSKADSRLAPSTNVDHRIRNQQISLNSLGLIMRSKHVCEQLSP